MMGEFVCKGIPAWWVNGWLAAVGATVLDDRLRLHWTRGDNLAVLSADGCDPIDILLKAWPDEALLADLPIAEVWKDTERLGQNVPVGTFSSRAVSSRRHEHSWVLSSTMTDLVVDKDGYAKSAPFNPSAPKGRTLHNRLVSVHGKVDATCLLIQKSLNGQGVRVQANGLGFDHGRIGSLADKTDRWVDAVVEVLAFFGLALLPMRGSGHDGRLPGAHHAKARQRGWRIPPGNSEMRQFHWPAWRQPLDVDGIDGLLDAWNPYGKKQWPSLRIHAGWRSVEYKDNNRMNPTTSYGAERL